MKKLFITFVFALLLTLSATAKTHKYDIIPPESLSFDLEHEDSLNCTVYLEESGLFGVRVRSVTTTDGFPPSITLSLFDKGTEITTFSTDDYGFDENKYYLLEGLGEGEYTLKIANNTNFSDVSFSIETMFTPWDFPEAQKGDSFDSATQMELSQRYKGGVMLTDDSDIFSFVMPRDGYAVIDLYSPELKFFTLYDSGKNVIGVMDVKIEEQNKVFETRCGLTSGTYYISVSPEEDYLNPEYSLEVKAYYDAEFESEYNNHPEKADKLSFGKELRGNLFGYEDEDVYSFTLNQKSTVKATLTDLYLATNGHYDFSILNSDGSPIITRSRCNTYTFEQTLDKGTYYLSVSCPSPGYFTSFGYKIGVTAKAVDGNDTKDEVFEDSSAETPSPVLPDSDTGDGKLPGVLQFDDVSDDSWYAKDLLSAREIGLIEGVGENNFNPGGSVSVAEAVTMAARMYEKLSGAKITAVDGEKWYTGYVLYAVAAGIISPDDFSGYDANATRAQMAYIFAGVLKNASFDPISDKEVNIPDVDEKEKYFKEIQLLYKLGILDGVDEKGTFLPDSSITRAESAVIMLRVAKLLNI